MRGIINTIVGGLANGESSTTSKKRHLRVVKSMNSVLNKPQHTMPNITFTYEDFQTIDPDQNDPMVVTIEISDYAIMKTLVDQGS